MRELGRVPPPSPEEVEAARLRFMTLLAHERLTPRSRLDGTIPARASLILAMVLAAALLALQR